MGWIFKYAIGTLTGSTLAPDNVEKYGNAFWRMASAFGNNGWQIGALIICMLILMLGVGGGIERAGKNHDATFLLPVYYSGSLRCIPAGSH